MDQASLETILAELNIEHIRYFDRLGSTNEEAARWSAAGAPDLALVVADEQTAGKGRLGRRWVTPPGSSLAFSLVLHPDAPAVEALPRWSALGALAVCEALSELYGLRAEIKWPNDVLLERRKAAGVLAEMAWAGDTPQGLVLGIGINVAPEAVSAAASTGTSLIFPAACVEEFLDRRVDRPILLRGVIQRIIAWRPRLAAPEFLKAWQARLAFRGERVQFLPGETPAGEALEGEIIGLAPDGALRLRTLAGAEIVVRVGDVRLRPV